MAAILSNSVFFHIPKTGGTWVRAVLENAGLVRAELRCRRDLCLDPKLNPPPPCCMHCTPQAFEPTDGVPAFRFGFVRHPASFYQSYWAYKMMNGWGWQNPVDRRSAKSTFVEFVEKMVTDYPHGFAAVQLESYAGTADAPLLDFVGRQEYLTEDLITALDRAGERFDRREIRRRKPINVASLSPAWSSACAYTRELFEAVCACEKRITDRFGYTADFDRFRHAARAA